MARTYKRKPGARNYCNYTKETLEKCLAEVKNGLSISKASKKFGIHRNTISNKIHAKHSKSHGGQVLLTQDEEGYFSQYCTTMAEWGFPLDRTDLRYVVKDYLDKQGRVVPNFKDNMPGDDWARGFIDRQSKVLKERLAANIKRNRANISRTIVNDFFDHLAPEIEGVPASNIFNYDETNLSDDPGSKKVIVKRTSKYPDRLMNSSKNSISLMFCGSASGCILPPYVVYKAENVYDLWILGGPKGARYNRTKSGWFDLNTFEDWVEKLFIPNVRRLEGKKILIGDNVSSHMSLRVLKLCEDNDIKVIFFPPNSTHLLQPLDVAFFAPLKKEWRKILTQWKSTAKGKDATSLDKCQFPRLLNKLVTNVEISSENLKSGFRATGIFPLERNKVLDKLPVEDVKVINEAISEVFISHLKGMRYTENPGAKKRKKKMNTPPGKSVSSEDFQDFDAAVPSKSGQKRTRQQRDSSSDDNEEEEDEVPYKKPKFQDIKVGGHLILTYEGELFPGKVLAIDKTN